MLFLIGFVIVIASVLGGYAGAGGKLYILWQPFEYIIIGGAALGAFVIANSMPVIKGTGMGMKILISGTPYSKKEPYLDAIGFFFELSKMMRTKGIKEVEQHIDHPHESSLFQKYPSLTKDHHVEKFICDNVRLIVMGSSTPNQLEDLMDEELHIHHKERHAISSAMQTVADGMPALGIVAAVLGVIKTMGSITEPPEILGKLIGMALVGTFSGVWFAYGFIAPMAKNMENAFNSEGAFYTCLKIGILNFARQVSPQLIAEYMRKQMPNDLKPGFDEVEQLLAATSGGEAK